MYIYTRMGINVYVLTKGDKATKSAEYLLFNLSHTHTTKTPFTQTRYYIYIFKGKKERKKKRERT